MKKTKKFIKIIFILAFLILFYAYFIEPNLLITKNVTVIKSADLDVPNYKIAFFSDTHFGKFYDEKNMERIVDIINENEVDLVIFGGDFFDEYSRDKDDLDVEYLGEQLSRIESTYGKYAVSGNHDFGGRAYRVFYDLFSNNGFNVLNNENVFIDELNTRIIGFDDYFYGNTNFDYFSIKSTDFNILVSHEPDIIDYINMQNSGIMLSGHTHGGQIYIPFLYNIALPNMGKIYVQGVYDNVSINENVSLFVSKGIGTTILPLRFLNVPEVCIIELTE